jgi:hypothetical protein
MLWRHAPEVEEIAGELIAEVHTDLLAVRIEYLFMDKVPMSNGRMVLGRARRVSGMTAFFAQFGLGQDLARADRFESVAPFGVIEIAEPAWGELRPRQRRALVDHELCHLKVDFDVEPPRLGVRGHDVEEFTSVLRRHGLWSSASQGAGRALAESFADALDGIEMYVNGPDDDVGSG